MRDDAQSIKQLASVDDFSWKCPTCLFAELLFANSSLVITADTFLQDLIGHTALCSHSSEAHEVFRVDEDTTGMVVSNFIVFVTYNTHSHSHIPKMENQQLVQQQTQPLINRFQRIGYLIGHKVQLCCVYLEM